MKIKEFYWKIYHIIFNKSKRKILKSVINSHPFDFSYLLQVELDYMKYMKNYFDISKISTKNMKELGWAINILQLFLNDDYYHYHFNKPKKQTDGTFIFDKGTYKCDVYVNIKNIKRFIPKYHNETEEIYNNVLQYILEHPHELYKAKLWHLYNLIRLRYMQYWWD